jgi:ribose transport system substrate-binding protein
MLMNRCRVAASAVLIAAGIALAPFAAAQPAPGLSEPVVLPPFQPADTRCSSPSDRARELVFVRDNGRDFMSGVSYGLSLAARDRGLAFRELDAANDAAEQLSQVERLAAEEVGAVVAAPVDARALAPHLERLLQDGAYVGTIVPPPATTILNAPQYLTGRVLAEAAVDHIRTSLGGNANVVLLTHDSLEFLSPRFAAMRDALRNVPGATIVADISPLTVDNQGGYDTMMTVLLAEPDIDVVLGADTVVLGALAAMRDAGAARPDQFFGGIDGEPEAVAELKTPGSPFRITVSLASPVFGYAMGQQAADFLEGGHVPQAMDILPFALTPETLSSYEEDVANPGAVYADPSRRDRYLRMYGGICYDSRDRYLNFPWSSEQGG